MKKKIAICSLITVIINIYSVYGYAYTKITQSSTAEKAVVEADGYSPFEISPIIVLKSDKTLSDLEKATNGESSEKLTDVVEYIGSASADKDGLLKTEIDFSSLNFGNTYGVLVNGRLYSLKYVSDDYRKSVINDMVSAADSGNKETLSNLFSENKYCLSVDNNVLDICASLSDTNITDILLNELKGKESLTVEETADIIQKTMLTAAMNAGKMSDKEILDHVFTDGKYGQGNAELKDKIKAEGIKTFIRNINNKNYKSIAVADEQIAKELVLDAICYSKVETTSELLLLLKEYNNILNLNLTEFNKLSDGEQANAIRNFASSKPSLATAQNTLDTVVALFAASDRKNEQGNAGGSSSGGTGKIGGSEVGTYIGVKGTVFNDISDYLWAQDAINSLYSSGIISGYGDGNFAPQNNIKREEFVTIVVSAFYKNSEQGNINFSDVSETDWYFKNIAVASKCGIINGMSDSMFGIGQNITRQDMAVILYRIAGGKLKVPYDYNVFSDDGNIADYAKNAVYALRAVGVINGVTTNEFAPQKYATRAETAVMVHRFMSVIGKVGA